MDEWLTRNFVLGWVLASLVYFAVAGMHLYGLYENYPSTIGDAALWGSLGLLHLSLALAFRFKAKPQAGTDSV